MISFCLRKLFYDIFVLICRYMSKVYDFIIIGAGVCGLSCAHTLIHELSIPKGDVLVLEAQDYVGGRVKQDVGKVVPGMTIELGGEFMHGMDTSLVDFADEFGLERVSVFPWAQGDGGPVEEEVDGGFALYYLGDQDRVIKYDEEDASLENFHELNDILHSIGTIPQNSIPPTNLSLLSFLTTKHPSSMSSPYSTSLANAGYANTICSPINDLSIPVMAEWEEVWDQEGEEEGDSKLTGTFSQLIDHLKDQVPILLSTPISLIDSATNPDIVQVVGKSGEIWYCRKVVVTVSIKCLQDEIISFLPPLSIPKQIIINREASMRFV